MDNRKVEKVKPENYWQFINNKLENPEDIWSDFFQNQVDDSVRVLSFLTVFNGQDIEEKELNISYSNFKNNCGISHSDNTDHSFLAVRKLAIKSLLNRNQRFDKTFVYSLFNPSIGDFILNTYLEDIELIISIIRSLATSSSLVFLNSLKANSKIPNDVVEQIQLDLFTHLYESKIFEQDWDYLILLSYIVPFNSKSTPFINKFIAYLIKQDDASGERLYELLVVLNCLEPDFELNNCSFLKGFIEEKYLDSDDIEKLMKFLQNYSIEEVSIIHLIEEKVHEYLIDALKDESMSIEVGKHLIESNNDDGYEIDYSGIESDLSSLLDSIVSNFNAPNLHAIKIDDSEIISNLNLEDIVEHYFNSNVGNEDDFRGSSAKGSSLDNDIDAIFERN